MAEGDFLFVRPHCILVLKSPTRSSVQALTEAVRQVDRCNLQRIQEYVLLPLSQLLHLTDLTQEVVVDAIRCIQEIISLTQVKSWNVFTDISFEVIRVISNIEKGSDSPVQAKASDELKQAVVSCLMMLVDKSLESVLERFYGDQFLPRMGHIIYLLLYLAEHEACHKTRLLSLECLKFFGKGLSITKLRNKTKDCLSMFIPGISVTLTKIGTECGLTSQAVIVSALKAWSILIFEVFDDEQFNSGELIDNQRGKELKNGESFMKAQARTEEWVRMASEKIAILSQKLSVLECHNNWNVRCTLSEWAGGLLCKCKRSLADSIPTCLGILISLSADQYPAIKEASQRHLSDFSSKLSSNERSIIETLQENLLELVMELPTIFRYSGDTKKLSTLDKLNGYLDILGPSLNVVLNSASHLEKLSFSLLHVSEIDCRNVPMIFEKAIRCEENPIDNFVANPPSKIRKRFLNFDDERIHSRIIQICRTLGKFGRLQVLVDHFLERFHESIIYRKQALFLLNEIIVGVSLQQDNTQEDIYSIIRYIIDEYTDASIWDSMVSIDSNNAENGNQASEVEQRLVVVKPAEDESVNVVSSNAFQSCLLLEGIGSCAQVLAEQFNPLLMSVLYNVLEKLGSANVLVSHSAYLTLVQIADFCKYSSLSDLILKNADYLLNSLSIKLRYNPYDLKGPVVLRVTLEHCDKEMLELSKDIVDELLKNLDARPEFNLTLYLHVLYTLANAILKWFPPKKVLPSSRSNRNLSREDELSVCEYIKEYHDAKLKLDEALAMDAQALDMDAPTLDSETSTNDNVTQIPEDEKKPSTPTYVEIIIKILERCSHLLPSKSQTQVLLVLEIVNISVAVLQDREDDLLPMVHKIWAPLSLRFSQDNLLVSKMAFNTLCTLASICGDFVRRDILKDVWPKIILFLDKQHLLCLNRKGTAYQFTAAYKLLLDVLLNIGKMVDMLQISTLLLDDLASVTVLYLSCRQPADVQKAAVKLFEDLISVNSDLVWLKLVDVYCDASHLPNPPENSGFMPIKVNGQYNGNAVYKKNVLLLLEFLDKSETRFAFG